MRLKLPVIALLSLLISCDKQENCNNIDVSAVDARVEIEHLTSAIALLKSPTDVTTFLDTTPVFSRHILGRGSLPDSIFLKNITARLLHQEFRTLAGNTFVVFQNFTPLEEELTDALKRVHYYFPDYKIPRVITGVTGFIDNTQLVNLDSIVFIGLDYFLGDESPYQPNTFEYMKPFYRKEMVTRSVIFAKVGPDLLKTKQSSSTSDTPLQIVNNNITLLDDMITFGRLLYFTKKTLNCPHDSIVTGYTTKELAILRDNKQMLWEHFIKNELLYKTDQTLKVRYMDPRPFTNEISQECPGRLGQWFGYQIVKQYMEKNPEVTLPQLMEETDEQVIFTNSKFRP